ncbi:MAG: YeeE/YedE family protein [Chloroflexi bacterium]|nr:YeeE/YedE family protein [Chloroflexota bacterium]
MALPQALLALLIGILFGYALNKGGLTRYRKVVGVFRFTDLTVIKFMLTALVVAGSGLYALKGLGLVQFPTVPATYVAGNLIGGLVFGIGMALTGY